MSHELFYTSARRGLKPGSQGFCTVAQTRNLPATLAERLEALSGYRPALPPQDSRADLNPVVQAHYRLGLGGQQTEVLSYVSAAGLDYTQRHNMFAHHVVLEVDELPDGGPAWLLQQPGFMARHWEGEPKVLAAGRRTPQGDSLPGVCRQWDRVTGDAGWAGVLAGAFLADASRVAYLLFEVGLDPLPLLAEAIGLLPVERRWEVTFSTYYTGLPQGVRCAWRCVLANSQEATEAARLPGALVLNLCESLGPAPDSDLARQARSGQRPVARARRPVERTVPVTVPLTRAAFEPAGTDREAPIKGREVPIKEPALDHSGEARPMPPKKPPRPPMRPSGPRGWLVPSLLFGLLIGLPMAAGGFAAGRYLPQQEKASPPRSDPGSAVRDERRLREELEPLEKRAAAKENCVSQVAASLEIAQFPNLAKLLQQQEKEVKKLQQEGTQLRENLKNAHADKTALAASDAALRTTTSDLALSKKQLQTAGVIIGHHKLLLDHLTGKQDPVLVEQKLQQLRELGRRLHDQARIIQLPNADHAKVEGDLKKIQEDIKNITELKKPPENTPPKVSETQDPKEILKQAEDKVKEYESARDMRQVDMAQKAKAAAYSLLGKLKKMEYDKEKNAFEERLKKTLPQGK